MTILTDKKLIKEKFISLGLTEKIKEEGWLELLSPSKIKQLCIDAYKDDVITDEKYFIDHGIPEWFMKEIKKAHLFAGGKGHQNLYWNWTKNKKFPKATVYNFLEFIRVYGGKDDSNKNV